VGSALLQLSHAFTPLHTAKAWSRKPYFDAPAPTSPDARRWVAWNATLERQNVRTIVHGGYWMLVLHYRKHLVLHLG
jgi:hypothetical protein